MINYILPPVLQQLADSIRDKSLRRKVARVQAFFTRYTYFVTDKKYFVTPTEMVLAGGGDCKAHAIGKYLVLHASGVPLDQLWLIITKNVQRTKHMILMVGDQVLDLRALTYNVPNVPYIPMFAINHESRGFCENACEAWFGFGDPKKIIWDFTWYNFDTPFWRLMHTFSFWSWNKYVKKLEEEKVNAEKSFAQQLQATPFERAVAEVGIVPDARHVSPETEAEVQAIFAQAGGQISPALWGKLSARGQAEMSKFAQQNKSGLMAVANKLGVKL